MTKLAVVQMSMSDDLEKNVTKALSLVGEACSAGAHIVLLPELFEGYYFPQVEREAHFRRAFPLEGHPFIKRFQEIAKKNSCVLPLSFFERAGQAHYNSLVMLDADGANLGLYRKSHIPDGPGYEEKYYFNGGDTGFKAFRTRYGTIGAGICWDQWYPECARVMALLGAEILVYPTAIGSEPHESGSVDTREMWQRAMIGHAVSNSCYVAAANRVGTETIENLSQTFYGSSFVSDYTGTKIGEAGTAEETILITQLDLDTCRSFRAGMGFFRDRRPELYRALLTLDGSQEMPSR
jgi:N-carbamoylputrescine amidase